MMSIGIENSDHLTNLQRMSQ